MTTDQMPLTGCNHPSGWSNEIRAIAMESFPYAQLVVNAYHDPKETFLMGPEWARLEAHENNEHGMAYDVWERKRPGVRREIVLAFRGTEFKETSDWFDGSFATKQNKDGVEVFRRARRAYPDADFVVAGHSLGGGISTQISLSEPGVRSYIFNSSPRFHAPSPPQTNPRVSIAERGEVLKAVRALGREATQTYYSINCSRGNPITQHGSALLAGCLTRIASWQSDAARASLALNHIAPPEPAVRPGKPDCRRRWF